MKNVINPNLLDDKNWVETISADYNRYFTEWIQECRQGNLEEDDILKAAKKVSEYKEDPSIYDEIKNRLG